MAAFDTVTKIIGEARVLLQDLVNSPYRYSDEELLGGLNLALLEARRLRPDMFLDTPTEVPSYSAVDSTELDIDQQYRSAILYYIVGHAHLRDEEETTDARAAALKGLFREQLIGGKLA